VSSMKKPPATTAIGLNLAPLVDVIMCLLIFFMLATRMVQRENSRIDLPLATAAREADKQALGSRVVVNIPRSISENLADAAYLLDGDLVTIEEVYARLEMEGELHPDINCVIRAGREVPYRFVEAVLIGCARARIGSITFSALRGERSRR